MGKPSPSVQIETRVAQPADEPAIRHLLAHAIRPAVRAWWWEEHLGQDVFILALVGGRPVGALLAWPDAGPVAWVRLAVLAGGVGTGPWLDECLPLLVAAARRLGASTLAWIDAGGWAGPALRARGFRLMTRLIALRKADRRLPTVPSSLVRLRDARPEDVEEVAEVDHAAFAPPWWLSAPTLDRLRRQSAHFLVAERSGRCVGYVEERVMERGAHIGRLAVAPPFQGRGIGGLLLAEVLTRTWEQGIERVTLNTQEENLASRRLYRRFGFRPYGMMVPVWERPL